MSLTIRSNIASLTSQRRLSEATTLLREVNERLSSGLRINSASDDPAGLAVADSLRLDTKVYTQGIRNINDGISTLSIAESAITELTNIVTRVRELATQASSDTLTMSQRAALDEEAQALAEEFSRIQQSTDFNNIGLLNGESETIKIQAGYGEDGGISDGVGNYLGAGTFESASNYGVGQNPQEVTLGDVNGDGFLDMVTANTSSYDTSVVLGNGDGTFQAAQTFDVGLIPYAVALDDVNNDGKLDMVAGNFFGNGISVLIGNGNGTFQGHVSQSAFGTSTVSIDLGDVNNDGNIDLLAGNFGTDSTTVLLGNGDGTFGIGAGAIVGNGPFSAKFGDINGDGNLDIITANKNSGDVSVILGNGNATFSSVTTYGAGVGSHSVDFGDLNGDGNVDIVVANSTSNDATVILGNGNGTFGSVTTFSTGDSSQGIKLGDLNGDGSLDIVTANRSDGEATVLLGKGDGTFNDAVTYTAGASIYSVDLGDLNGDGILDIVTANNGPDNTSVLLGEARGGVAPMLEFSLRTQSDALQALAPLERKLDTLTQQQGEIGAFQSRLSTAANVLTTSRENLITAESQIRDTDVALEAARLVKYNILQEISASVLAQANQQPEQVLKLLK
jgi:flagellin-like hook-associated protein FlgL